MQQNANAHGTSREAVTLFGQTRTQLKKTSGCFNLFGNVCGTCVTDWVSWNALETPQEREKLLETVLGICDTGLLETNAKAVASQRLT